MARSQSLFEEKRVTSSLSKVIAPPKKFKIVHVPEAAGEAMPIYFSPPLAEICLDYLAGDIDPAPQDKKAEKVS